MKWILDWVIPKDIWDGFRLDYIVYVDAYKNVFGEWAYKWVFSDFHEQIKDKYIKHDDQTPSS